jgi:DeoR/GlpR family transcriptional regulator of sugar metabolism
MNERQRAILRKLTADGELQVKELSEMFNVSAVTVRQDLSHLEHEGLLKRIHGGAVLANKDDISYRMGINFDAKQRIAETAASFVSDGETVFIEAGSANALLARQLARRERITVITINVYITRMLRNSGVHTILLGGIYQQESECLVGRLAQMGLETVNFLKAFIGVDGFTRESGFTSSDMMRAELAAAAIKRAQESYIITDSAKFGRVSAAKICDLEDVDHVITDSGVSGDTRAFLEEHGVTVHI